MEKDPPGNPYGINRATVAVLVTIGGLGLAEHVWRGFLGPYLAHVTNDLGQAVWIMAAVPAVSATAILRLKFMSESSRMKSPVGSELLLHRIVK